MASVRVAIVGAGIVGLAHAWSAAERGCRVTVFERTPRACGASIRNFGMIWPIGQPAGVWRHVALESRQRWLTLEPAAGVWVNPCGSIHLAHRDDEWSVLQEFENLANGLGYECSLLSPDEIQRQTPSANPAGLRGGLWSPTELVVDPPRSLPRIAAWLEQAHAVRVQFNAHVVAVAPAGPANGIQVELSCGRRERFDRAIVCGGAEVRSLFPEVLANAGLRLCKLQMLKTQPQPAGWRLGPHLASGLTLRHYRNFAVCASLEQVRKRVAAETPELDRFGIHVMAAQNDAGEVILGDSHEYDGDVEPFDKAAIDELILRELHKVVSLPDWTIARRWHGCYLKAADGQPVFESEPLPRVHICTGTGGAGMTMAFGLAEQAWHRWSQESPQSPQSPGIFA